MVKISVGNDGQIDIEQTLCDVFLYPNGCLVREYFHWSDDLVSDFSGLTPCQTLYNFVPFVGWKTSEFNGDVCQILCTADGKDQLVDRILLINLPPNKVAKRLVVVDSDGVEIQQQEFPEDVGNIQQLTINLPRFLNLDTQEMCQVRLPSPTLPIPPPQPPCPPANCAGFEPSCVDGTVPFNP